MLLASREASTLTKEPTKKQEQMLEQHYSPMQLAKRWGFSDEFVRGLFRGEEGVILVNRPERMHKRGYVTMRIPESVAERVYARLVKKRPTSLAAVRAADIQKLA